MLRYAAHARTFFLSDFVSVENEGSKIQIPKLKAASSSPSPAPDFVAIFSTNFSNVSKLDKSLASVMQFLSAQMPVLPRQTSS